MIIGIARGKYTLINETRLSFADENELQQKLGVKRGAVSLLNIINGVDDNIKVLLDKEIFLSKNVGFHPNVNTETLIFGSENIKKLLDDFKVKYQIVVM